MSVLVVTRHSDAVIEQPGAFSGLVSSPAVKIGIDTSTDPETFYKNEDGTWVPISALQAQQILDELGNTIVDDLGNQIISG